LTKNQPYAKDRPEHEALLMKLWSATFPGVTLDTRISEQWKLIGFQGTDPATDFRGMGLLGLQNLLYFAEIYPEIFRKIVTVQAERKERDYPVAVAGINITQMLYELFLINQEDQPDDLIFNVLFDSPKGFEEVYCIAFKILDSTWDEMNASYMDFPRVIAAVKKQIGDVLITNPTSVDQFNRAATWSGARKQPTQAIEEEETSEPEAVKVLRSKLKQEILQLIKEQRKAFLFRGAWFKVYKPKSKQQQFAYCRVTETQPHEVLFGLFALNDKLPQLSELSVIAKTNEIAELTTGANTSMFSKQKKIINTRRRSSCIIIFIGVERGW